MDRLSVMEVFVRVVDEGGFSAAARRLNLSKAAISKQVAALENRLGVRLLNRTTRQVTLTDAGAVFHARAQRILAEAEEAETEIGTLAAAPRGVLRINVPMTFGVRHIGPLMPEFMDRYPDLIPEISLSDRFVDVLEEGVDVVVRISSLTDSSLIAKRLCCNSRVLVASPDYLARRGTPQRPEDLIDHDCLLYTYLKREGVWELSGPAGRQIAVRVAEPKMRANNGEIILAAARAGQGIAYSPMFMAGDDIRAGRLVQVLPDWRDERASVFAVHAHTRFVPAKVRVFIDFLAEKFAGKPAWEP